MIKTVPPSSWMVIAEQSETTETTIILIILIIDNCSIISKNLQSSNIFGSGFEFASSLVISKMFSTLSTTSTIIITGSNGINYDHHHHHYHDNNKNHLVFIDTSNENISSSNLYQDGSFSLISSSPSSSYVFMNSSLSSSSLSSTLASTSNYPIAIASHEEEESNENALLQQYLRNQALDTPSLITLVIIYAVLIFIGAFGNGLVCLAVARQPKMRTSRNLFIVNLAISDLLLCFFTIPFSLIEIVTKFWPYGITMCKLVLTLEATSIFVSTLSFIAIALDRYHVILQSMSAEQCQKPTIPNIVKLILIWIVGVFMAMPLFLFRTIESHYIGIGQIDTIKFCIEKWPIPHGRGYYSVFSMLIQYVFPITIVSIVYTRLCMKLRSRTLQRASSTQLPKLRSRLQRRARKTNLLLISIALIFFLSWLPLNVLNIVADLSFPFSSDRSFRITFAVCHMAGMSSSCSNPFLYGWLNQTFRNEFLEIFNGFKQSFFRVFLCRKPQQNDSSLVRHRDLEQSNSFSPNHKFIPFRTSPPPPPPPPLFQLNNIQSPIIENGIITTTTTIANHHQENDQKFNTIDTGQCDDIKVSFELEKNEIKMIVPPLSVSGINRSIPIYSTSPLIFEKINDCCCSIDEKIQDKNHFSIIKPVDHMMDTNSSEDDHHHHQNQDVANLYFRSSNQKFKRLSLTDSRRRRRKNFQQSSINRENSVDDQTNDMLLLDDKEKNGKKYSVTFSSNTNFNHHYHPPPPSQQQQQQPQKISSPKSLVGLDYSATNHR